MLQCRVSEIPPSWAQRDRVWQNWHFKSKFLVAIFFCYKLNWAFFHVSFLTSIRMKNTWSPSCHTLKKKQSVSTCYVLILFSNKSGAVMQAVCRISDGLLLTPPPQGRGLPAITYPQHMWTRHSSVQSKTSNNPSHAPEVGNLERQSSIRSTLSSAEVFTFLSSQSNASFFIHNASAEV